MSSKHDKISNRSNIDDILDVWDVCVDNNDLYDNHVNNIDVDTHLNSNNSYDLDSSDNLINLNKVWDELLEYREISATEK